MPMLDPSIFDSSTYDTPSISPEMLKLLTSVPMSDTGTPAPPLSPPINVGFAPGNQPPPVPMTNPPPMDGGMLMPARPPMPWAPRVASDPAALPETAAPTSGPATPSAVPPPVPPTSVLGRIGDAINSRSNTLLALGAGFANAQNVGQGLQRGLSLAIPAQQVDVKQQQQNQSYQVIRNKLIAAGKSPEEADAIAKGAIGNSDIMKQILGLFGPKQLTPEKLKGAFGEDQPASFNPATGEWLDASGRRLGGGVGSGSAFLAKGVGSLNNELAGDDYLKQFAPETQAAVKDYIDGKTMPTGNPRQGSAQMIKMIAQKYGNDVGTPADDSNFAARRDMRTQLSKGTPGTLGGQITFGGTSLGHLADTAEKATKLENVNGFGVAPLANLINSTRGLGTDQAAKVNEVSGAVQHYGQEITKFYTGSPGGEAERMRFLKTIDTSKSSKEIAGAIRTERDLIPDRINQIGAQISDRLGPEEAQKQLRRANIDGQVNRINAALARLDPDGPEAKTANVDARGVPSAAVVPPHVQSLPMSQQMRTAPEGSIVRFGQQRLMKTGGQWQPMQ